MPLIGNGAERVTDGFKEGMSPWPRDKKQRAESLEFHAGCTTQLLCAAKSVCAPWLSWRQNGRTHTAASTTITAQSIAAPKQASYDSV